MSGDQPIASFGDPNAQPPTPKQTPTSVTFPSPVFETPKQHQGSFDESSGWTPRFAEEYSVFNATPGNLRGSHGTFQDFSVSNPYPTSAGHKRLLSAENIATEIATHVNHFSPNLRVPLPPVDPSRRLPSSPGLLTSGASPADTEDPSEYSERSAKKARRGTLKEVQGQTATPPPSARKGERKLAPRLQTDIMQHDQGYGQEYVAGTPQQNGMPNFVTTPNDMFGYPMSAPATAPVFADSRSFWDTDPNMTGMDLDFSAAASANIFQTPNHRPMSSMDWGRSNEMFQDTGVVPQSHDNGAQPKSQRALAPKPVVPPLETGEHDTSMFGTSFGAPIDDPFAMVTHGDGVDPGLLFTRPPSSNMELAAFDPFAQAPLMQSMSQPEPLQIPVPQPARGMLRRSASTKEISTKKKYDKVSASSPIKPSGRPGLARSFSENRGKKPVGRASTLPTLAPASRPTPQNNTSRPASQVSRPGGRTSPLKNHHHRLSSLSSIPESATPRTRTSVKFTIDSRGRARAETTTLVVDGEESSPTTLRGSRTEPRKKRGSWGPPSDNDEEDSSSSDDEPIVIPSRNTSFALPDPRKPSSTHPFHSSRRSVSEHSTSSLGIFFNEPGSANNDVESEAETVMVEPESSQGDAASELRKMVQDRQKRMSLNTNQRFVSGPYSASSTISPTTITEASLPTPSSSGGNSVRCICKKTESPSNSDGFMVQCESCEMWLHGKCTKISRRTLPRVYICAFCANTPTAHGARGREAGRSVGGQNRGSAPSPLAHKSFKSFR